MVSPACWLVVSVLTVWAPGWVQEAQGVAEADAEAVVDTDAESEATPAEADYYALHTVPIPDGIVLEVGGLLPRDDGSLFVCTRRGDLFLVEDAASAHPVFRRWADGLQEPLGLLADGESVLVTQRGELSRLSDTDGDLRADVYETVADDWELSGSYHEYAFGPARDSDGNLWITLNIPFGDRPFGTVDWRGWAMRLTPDGELQPVCAGLRSPAGVAVSPWGDVFYTDNQGEWNGASKLSQLVPGGFHGHPLGIDSAHRPGSRVEHPGHIPDGVLMPTAARRIPGFTLPAVWFPYDVTGRSPSGMAWDTTGGAFGPFDGQLFVGDQYGANILRVFLEQVDDVWQGACFRFREGLQSGVTRVAFDGTGGLWAGSSDRGWPSLGPDAWGLQRLSWTGELPFEIRTLEATPEGFRMGFTAPVDEASLDAPDSWALRRFTYRLHSDYGSPEVDDWELGVADIELSADRRALELSVPGLREGYVHEVVASGLRDVHGRPLLHHTAWYTLIRRPGGPRLPRVVFVATEDDEDGLRGLRALAEDVTASKRWQCEVLGVAQADVGSVSEPDARSAPTAALFKALRDADLVVLQLGGLAPDRADLEVLLTYVDSGRPLVALRAGSPVFAKNLTADPELAQRLEDFDADVLGLRPGASTDGVDSWLTDDCVRLLDARDADGTPGPRIWTRERGGARFLISAPGAEELATDPALHEALLDRLDWTLDLAPDAAELRAGDG